MGNYGDEDVGGRHLELLLLGDCMLGRLVNEVLENSEPDYPWGDTLPILRSADWRFCNLECVISDRGTPWSAYPKAFHFRSSARNVAVFTSAGIDAVSVANNHVLDFGYEALIEMLQILDQAGIVHSGAGLDCERASRLATARVRGEKIGLLAFTDNEPDWEATPTRPGTFYVPTDLADSRATNLLNIVRQSSGTVDLLIVSAHWGSNWGYEPPEEHISFAHALVEAGADVVFGHSSHVFRGIEFHNGRPIFYGAGNFVDDYAVDKTERNDRSFIYVIEMTDRLPARVCLSPTLIRGCHASLAKGIQASRIADKMVDLCAALSTRATWNPERQRLELKGLDLTERSARSEL
jgi:poly-gamma-glutamate capsule biosynthesis protein CapA/YwtB (metallophosphatase superfamily)